MANTVSFFQPPPIQAQMTDKNGYLTPSWQKWFQQLYLRNGGPTAIPNVQLTDNTIALATVLIGSINTTVYTSPAGLSTVIDAFQISNTDVISHTVSVYFVPASSTPQLSNQVVTGLSILGGATTNISTLVSQVIGSGGTIVAIADVPNVIRAAISGRQVS